MYQNVTPERNYTTVCSRQVMMEYYVSYRSYLFYRNGFPFLFCFKGFVSLAKIDFFYQVLQSLIKSNECTLGKRDLKPVRNVEQNFTITLLFESVRTEKIASMTKIRIFFTSKICER